jgi:ABC-2 type transport system permease protein
MKKLLSAALVIARRDFVSIVFTPTFLLFLLAPLLMIGFGAVGGMTSSGMMQSAGASERVVAIVPQAETAAFTAADARLRGVAGGPAGAPRLIVMADSAAHRDAVPALRRDADVLAILTGPAAAPAIAERSQDGFAGRYLATLAETVAREGADAARTQAASTPRFTRIAAAGPARGAQSGLGYGIVFIIFLLTLLLAGQTVGMLAEEKGNKVIEILAAAVPLQSVFFGKLLGMLGVAILFVAFWATLIGGLMIAAGSGASPEAALPLASFTPAVGWPLFVLLGIAYFLSAFLLFGAVFLGIGGLASTVREVQMLSMPITFFQIGMFALASAAANSPGGTLAHVAQILPWSSAFAMAARGATDAALWPHLLALAWQALWIAITIALSVRLFRVGVLRSGGGWTRGGARVAETQP